MKLDIGDDHRVHAAIFNSLFTTFANRDDAIKTGKYPAPHVEEQIEIVSSLKDILESLRDNRCC